MFLLLTSLLAQPHDPDALAGEFGYAASAECRACHPQHYAEWVGSVHAFVDRERSMPHGSFARSGLEDPACARCHGEDLTTILGARPLEHDVRLSHSAERGITCTVCHQIVDPLENHETVRDPETDCYPPGGVPGAALGKPFHDSKPMASLRDPGFCGPCHEVTAANGLKVERTYSQFLASVYPQRNTTCTTCHMRGYGGRMVPGGPFHEIVHRHDIIGTDVFANPVPALGSQRDRVAAFLRASASLFVHTPERVESGEPFALPVDVINSGAGHNLPAGEPGERRLWLEVTATLDDGTEIFRSGQGQRQLDASDEATKNELGVFTDRFLDAAGDEVPFWWQATRIDERSLRAHETRRVTYEIPVRRELSGRQLRVRVRLRFQACSPVQLREVGLGELVDTYPIFDLQVRESPPIAIVDSLVPPDVVRVPADVATIPEALARAPRGGTVIVDPGTYVLDRALDFGGKRVSLVSRDGADATVLTLSEAAASTERASVIFFASGESSETLLEGFTITGGRGTLWEGDRRGGGIFCRGSSPTLRGNHVRGNRVDGDGGGLYLVSSSATLEENRIEENRAGRHGGGLAVAGRSSAHLVRSLLYANSAGGDGGGAYSSGGLLVGDSLIQANQAEHGGGLTFDGRGGPDRTTADAGPIDRPAHVLYRVRVLGNGAVFGGGIDILDDEPAFERVVIAGNAARIGGALHVRGDRPLSFDHITVTENRAPSWGAIRLRGAAVIRARNSIFWDNGPPKLVGEITYSLVDDPAFATGTNISSPPLFVYAPGEWTECESVDEPGCVPIRWLGRPPRPAAYGRWIPGDYGLLSLSPAVSAGSPLSPPDVDDSRTDMGAVFKPTPLRGFRRGDVDGDGSIDLADAARLGEYLYARASISLERVTPEDLLAATPPCLDAADHDDRAGVTPVDLFLLLSYHFGLGRAPRAPFPDCGVDPTPADGVSCFEAQAECE